MTYNRGWVVPLQCANGEQAQHHEVPISDAGLLIGRREDCAIRLQGPTISAVQCKIYHNQIENRFELQDQSSNGTFLNARLLDKGSSAPLAHGDVCQLTKRWQNNPTLQFRFVLAPSPTTLGTTPRGVFDSGGGGKAAQHSDGTPGFAKPELPNRLDRASAPPTAVAPGIQLDRTRNFHADAPTAAPLAPIPPITTAPLVNGNIPGSAVAVTAEIREARQGLATTEVRLLELTTELSRLRSTDMPMPPARKPVLEEGTRVAGADAVLEAERARFTAQRGVLQTELAELHVVHARTKRELSLVEAVLVVDRKERTAMDANLNALLEKHAQQKGEQEAWQIRQGEIEQEVQTVIDSLEKARNVNYALSAKLHDTKAEIEAVRAEGYEVQRLIQSCGVSSQAIIGLASSLSEDMNGHASVLLASIEASGDPRESRQCNDVIAIDAIVDPHRENPCSAFSDMAGKENVMPASVTSTARRMPVDASRSKRQWQFGALSTEVGSARRITENAFTPARGGPASLNITMDASKRPRLGNCIPGAVGTAHVATKALRHPENGAVIIEDRIGLD